MENDVAQRWRGHYRRGPPGKGSVEGGVRGKADLATELPPVVSPPICRRERPPGLPFRPRPPLPEKIGGAVQDLGVTQLCT